MGSGVHPALGKRADVGVADPSKDQNSGNGELMLWLCMKSCTQKLMAPACFDMVKPCLY